MPTSYTQKLYYGENQTFEDFAMRCARAFGACITMRDDKLDENIPEKFYPSDFHRNEIKEKHRTLDLLLNMTQKQKQNYGQEKINEKINTNQMIIDENNIRNKRFEDMIMKVKQWTPPTKNHERLKEFMLEQLQMSIDNNDYYEQNIEEWKQKKPMEVYEHMVQDITTDIKYHNEQYQEEIERVNSRNEWLQQLRDSFNNAVTA